MTTVKEYNSYGEDLEKLLMLRTSPLAVKMIEKEADIPEGAFRPRKDKGHHYAQCQAFALSRREKLTVAMLKEDNWCPAPVTAYGLDERPERPDMRPGSSHLRGRGCRRGAERIPDRRRRPNGDNRNKRGL